MAGLLTSFVCGIFRGGGGNESLRGCLWQIIHSHQVTICFAFVSLKTRYYFLIVSSGNAMSVTDGNKVTRADVWRIVQQQCAVVRVLLCCSVGSTENAKNIRWGNWKGDPPPKKKVVFVLGLAAAEPPIAQTLNISNKKYYLCNLNRKSWK